jgi:hypothetical protein
VAIAEDPQREELIRHWRSFLAGEVSAEETSTWAESLLAQADWVEEIVFQGLTHLESVRSFDPEGSAPDFEAEQQLFWDWQERAHWYDDDRESWNRNHYRGFLSNLVRGANLERARRFAHSFARHSLLTESDIHDVLELEFRRTPTV